ncbi:SEFIR domain-containing protein, partial [Oscillibacter ruminantium]
MKENPRVFISYSQDSKRFADIVLSFSNKLRSEGIDAILDQYEESPAEGWPRWMEDNIRSADYVLIVGSLGYSNKINGQVKPGDGRGVKWEGNLIYQNMYMADTTNSKFIPVIFEEKDLEFIPTPLQGSTHYNISNKDGFDRLYWRLRGIT